MPHFPYDTPPERDRLARALALLRREAGMTQEQAAARINRTVQAWQNYEWGKRKFTETLAGEVTKALGLTVQDLLDARDRLPDEAPEPPAAPGRTAARDAAGPSLQLKVLGRVRAGPVGPNVYDQHDAEVIDFATFFSPDARVLRLAGESMIPYAEPGGFVVYHLSRWPRRGQGCVIETTAGEYYVKRYEKTDAGKLIVTELHPQERQLTFELSEIKGVYAIGLRGD